MNAPKGGITKVETQVSSANPERLTSGKTDGDNGHG